MIDNILNDRKHWILTVDTLKKIKEDYDGCNNNLLKVDLIQSLYTYWDCLTDNEKYCVASDKHTEMIRICEFVDKLIKVKCDKIKFKDFREFFTINYRPTILEKLLKINFYSYFEPDYSH